MASNEVFAFGKRGSEQPFSKKKKRFQTHCRFLTHTTELQKAVGYQLAGKNIGSALAIDESPLND